METLSLKDVKYEYRNKYQTVHALAGVTCVFKKGRFYAVAGKSGSGKTTMLSMLAGLDNPTSGEVFIGDKNVAVIDRDKYRLNHVSVIYQGLNLFPLLTAIENVMFPLEFKKTPKAEARRIAVEKLLSVGIDEPMHRRLPSMLSGGEQQRVAIARALANQNAFILADEPTGNLDTENSNNIVRLLKELARTENICVIVVTHDPAVASEADEILRINDGKIVDIETQ
jgi:putative ABC transport system ATP-binding protein